MNNDGKTTTVLLVGVGGQGIIRASDILSIVMMNAGLDVKKSEVHGMAQRGGCVSSCVRYGKKVYSPLEKKGDVDILLSFEKAETLRYLDRLNQETKVIINDEEVYPPSVNLGEAEYPANVVDIARQYCQDVKLVHATDIAIKAGDIRMANTAMLGALSAFMDIDTSVWDDVLRQVFPAKILDKNLQVFYEGRKV